MIKWGAVVDTADHDALIDYLRANFSPRRPAHEPPRTSPEKMKAEKASKSSAPKKQKRHRPNVPQDTTVAPLLLSPN